MLPKGSSYTAMMDLSPKKHTTYGFQTGSMMAIQPDPSGLLSMDQVAVPGVML